MGIGIIFLISILTVMTPRVLAIESFCDQHFDHGPTLGETIGKEQCENPISQINYNGVNLTVITAINKTTFKAGENITVVPEFTSVGNHNVTVGYCGQLFTTLTMDQFGKIVWPQYAWACPLFAQGMTLKPNTHTPGESYGQNITLYTPGNYTIVSIASFGYMSKTVVLWSKPVQIAILPEKIPEFPFAIAVFLASITSMIVFYRIKFT